MTTDFFDIDSALSEEERAVRDSVRRFVDERVLPIIAQHYLDGRFPLDLVPEMGALGVFGANLPEEYGCAGLNNVAYGLIMQELERGDSGVRSFASVQGALVMYPIFAFGSEAQKRQYLPKMAAGEIIGCFGLTEPDYGSNPERHDHDGARAEGRHVGAERRQDVDHQRLHRPDRRGVGQGQRRRARCVDPRVHRAQRREGVHGQGPEGQAVAAGQRHERTRLPGRAIAGRRRPARHGRGGLKSPLMCLTQARYGISWGAVGAAMACYEEALSYAKNRVMFDRPIAGFQIQQQRLADMLTEIVKGQLVSLHLGRLKDAGTYTPQQVSLAKRNNVNMATDMAREARRLLGANGILAEYASMRHMANLESVYTYEGTHDVHSLILGQAVTGLNAFK